MERTIPGFEEIMRKVHADADAREASRREKRAKQTKAEREKAKEKARAEMDGPLSGRYGGDL